MSEEEGLLRQNLKADGAAEVHEGYLLVLVKVKPVKQRANLRFFCLKAPVMDDGLKLVKGNVALAVSVQLVERLLQSFELQLHFADEHLLEVLQVARQD